MALSEKGDPMHTLILCAALATPAPTPPIEDGLPDVVEQIQPGQEIDWALSTVTTLRNMANERLWGPFVSVVIMALLSLLSFLIVRSKEVRDRLRPYMGEVALAASVLGYVALGVGTLPTGADAGEWWAVIGPGIKTGLAAVGGYELVVKRLLKHWWPKIWGLFKRLLPGKS
jgi:uncharacterized membrane protein